jgi:ATP-dependent DNA ligase
MPKPPAALPAPPEDLLAWRPMGPAITKRPPIISDPILEPLWTGARVMAHVTAGEPRVRIVDVFGVDLSGKLPELVAALAEVVDAQDAIIDGVITPEALRGGIGAAAITEPRTTVTSLIWKHDPGVAVVRRGPLEDVPEGFVAVDLLRVDGQSLLELPLLERKRLLESVVGQSERVRVSVFVRPPVDGWVATWQSAGLRGAMMKAANSRYELGGRTLEWRTVTQVAARR